MMGKYTVNTAGKSPADASGESTGEVCASKVIVMGKPAIVQPNVNPPLAASALMLDAAAASPGMAWKFLLQRAASIAAGKGFVNVAVSPEPR